MVHSYPDRGIPQVDNVEMEFDYIKTHENELIKNCYPEEDHISEESEEEYDLDFDVLSDILQPSDTADPLQSTNDSEDMNDFDSDPLYPGASVTLGAFMLLLAVFTSRYNLIGEATEQLLKIIALALPHGHKLCSSLYEFKLFFKNLRNPLVRHYYLITATIALVMLKIHRFQTVLMKFVEQHSVAKILVISLKCL